MFGQSRSITPGRCALSALLHGLSLQHQRILNAIEGVHNMGYSMTNKPSGVGRARSMQSPMRASLVNLMSNKAGITIGLKGLLVWQNKSNCENQNNNNLRKV